MIDKTDQNQQTYAFLCSICIPTYNRAETLSYTVHSFIESESFRAGKIELVISDNASNDKTQEINKLIGIVNAKISDLCAA